MSKPSIGVIVGRFQVHELHDAHMELFRIVRGRHNNVVVFLGVSPSGLTKYNPLDFVVRKRMIQAKFPDITVLPLADVSNDKLWSQRLDEQIRNLAWGDVTLYGGRDSFVPHYHGSYHPIELPIEGTISGTDIRDHLTNVVMESADFRAGIIYATANTRPRVIQTVDVAILYQDGDGRIKLLLGRKPNEGLWRFIGGHVEPTQTLEDAVRAETYEEANMSINSLVYLGSAFVDDWRWKKEDSKVTTAFFAGYVNENLAQAGSDIYEVQWFYMDVILRPRFPEVVNPIHRPLLTMLFKYLEEHDAKTTVQSVAANR